MFRHVPVFAVLVTLAFTPGLAQTGEEAPDVAELEKRIQSLERRLTVLEAKLKEQNRPQEAEKAASAMLQQIRALMGKGDVAGAQKLGAEVQSKYGSTQAVTRARSYLREITVIGKPAPASFEVEKWFVEAPGFDLNAGKATLIVFWEEWCPHCKREVPKMEKLYETYRGQGLQVIGLTKLTRGVTEETIEGFIQQHALTYPIAKEKGDLSAHFAVSGIPAAAIVKEGKVVWRGHPASLSDAMLKGFLEIDGSGA
jgi:thiol-disulfide isomerase/thioredoxin